MDRLKTFFLLTFLLSQQAQMLAQNQTSAKDIALIDKSLNEKIYINTNTNTFITGEKVFFKIYCLDKTKNIISKGSKLAYIELFDNTNKSILKQKIFLNNGIGYGDIFLPPTLETGSHTLIAYTNWMLNEPIQNYSEAGIFIINPYQVVKKTNSLDSIEKAKPNTTKATSENTFSQPLLANYIDISFSSLSSRSRGVLKIKELNGNYSLSIRRKDSLNLGSKLNAIAYSKIQNSEINSAIIAIENIQIPEVRGEIISGKITSISGKGSIENREIALSIPGKTNTFKISKTNSNGEFNFVLEEPNPNPNIIIQVISNDYSDYAVALTTSNKTVQIAPNNTSFELTPIYKKSIEDRLIASQIENAFFSSKKDSILTSTNITHFFDPLSKEYKLDNYTRFTSLKETIIEIVDGVYYKKTGSNYSIELKDYNNFTELTVPALVLVDGLYIQDINELFNYPATNIDKINIIKGGYIYGGKLFNGLISFTSKNFDYESKLKGTFIINPEILRPSPKKKYYTPKYTEANQKSRIPDYRYQLLWKPDLQLNGTETDIEFYTSDLTGTFEIILDGFTDKGESISLIKTIEVK